MKDLQELALSLIRENSENPPGNEAGVANIIKSRLGHYLGFREIKTGENRVNLVFGDGDYIVFNGHMDTVPIEGTGHITHSVRLLKIRFMAGDPLI